ncbi:hypothetical protein LCGC14_1776140 [marine sediment metagenome]|uniref:Peptidase S74 domain-containing protein n=1 Tax=marine sediment metagenome TaxID=412755 RepID=A0A0F9HJD6_9ZZZZ|nr:hypothetical protein [Candidatus Scalindua sp.]
MTGIKPDGTIQIAGDEESRIVEIPESVFMKAMIQQLFERVEVLEKKLQVMEIENVESSW